MKFRTEIPHNSSEFTIHHAQKLCFLGSCFTENIGRKMLDNQFNAIVNPFGVLYNPASIEKHLWSIIHGNEPDIKALYRHKDMYLHFDFHSKFSNPNKAKAIQQMQEAFHSVDLTSIDYLFITWGTARIYRNKADHSVVANCHKLPAKEFLREALSVDSIVNSYDTLIEKLRQVNPKLTIVLTVSPVRHLKDGFIENQRSKSRLILAAETLESRNPNVHYFPAYELMMDDLRDYRFYDDDLLHPNNQAQSYIWNYFSDYFFSDETKHINQEIEHLRKAKQHKLFFPDSEETKKFADAHFKKCQTLSKRYPNIDLQMYLDYFSGLIKK